MSKQLYDLTSPQKSIWLTEEFYKGTSIENLAGRITIQEKVDFKLLRKAINIFVKNNDSFRIQVTLEDNVAKQYIQPYVEFPIDVISVSNEEEIKKMEETLVRNTV